MRILLYGEGVEEILPDVREAGLEPVDEDPDVILSYGGDGTLLGAEREYPGVPKVAVRPPGSQGRTSERLMPVGVLKDLRQGRAVRQELMKLEVEANGQRRVALNDIIVHNGRVSSAVRYRMKINGKAYSGEIVGDGIVVSTPFGSTAYYRSITHGIFQVGIGLAFNNSIEPTDHMVLDPSAVIEVEITRGPALIVSDNDPSSIPLDRGERAVIRRHEATASIFTIDTLLFGKSERLRPSEEPPPRSS